MNIGDVIDGRFLLEAEAGAGGMGVVHRALDRLTGARVALKSMRATKDGAADRFVREANVLAELSHPSIVRYVAHGATATGESWLAMEWLAGEDLATRLARGRLDVREALGIAGQTAAALAAAHARGVVHRDVKPANVFLVDHGAERVRVLDFGIARLLDATAALTRTGAAIGTPGYMSPEQARGGRDVDARTDVFALGCVLFECLTGRPVFVGNSALAILAKILFEEPARVREHRSDVPAAVDALVARLLAKDPAERPGDGRAVAAALAALGDVDVEEKRGSTPPPTPPLTAAEQRLQCVVLVGTRRAGTGVAALAPVAATETDGAAVAALVRCAEAHGGRADVLADGALIVTFAGTGGDHATRGARAALAIKALVPDTAVVLATGMRDLAGRAPTGQVIDRAAALLQRPSRGDVGVDQTTAALLATRFDIVTDEHGTALRGEREVLDSARPLLGKPTRCFGREAELATLAATQAQTIAEPAARVVLVTAPAGAGKSRLSREFVLRASTEGERFIARGDPMTAGSMFGLVSQILRRAAGWFEGEAPAVRHEKLRARLARHLGGDELAHAAEFLGELAGAAAVQSSPRLLSARADPTCMNQQVRAAWEAFLRGECRAGPVLIVLEDLHWGDAPSVQLVDLALRALADLPLMVLALGRPEVHERFPKLWRDRDLHEVRLGPLGRRAGEAVVRGALGDAVAAADVARIVERAAGNAFYLEELIRAVAEGRPGELPESVLAIVQSRLDDLDDGARRALRAASVFGETFWRGGVAALLGGVSEHVDELVARELIEPRGVGKFPGEADYGFRHGLVREAAYATLVDADRVTAHARAGAWLEERGEQDARVLAEHFERAREPARALPFLVAAAQRAVETQDFDAAIALVRRGEACGAAGTTLGALRASEMFAGLSRLDFAHAERAALEAMALLEPGTRLWYQAAAMIAGTSPFTGNFEAFLSTIIALRQQPLSGEVGRPELLTTSMVMLGLAITGQGDDARTLLAQAEAKAEGVAERDPAAGGWLELSRFWLEPTLAGALLRVRAAEPLFVRGGDFLGMWQARLFQGLYLLAAGALEDAERLLRLVVASSVHTFDDGGAPAMLAMVLCGRGAHDDARLVVAQVVAGLAEPHNLFTEGTVRINVGTVLMDLGDLDAAEVHVGLGVDLGAMMPRNHCAALGNLARLRLLQGRTAEAVAAAGEARAVLDAVGTWENCEAGVRLVHAEALHAAGDVAAARASIGDARDRALARAAELEPLGLRESFLTRGPGVARTLALAAAWSA